MNQRTLLASIAFFTELYNSQKDVYDVIAEFIKAAMVLEKTRAFDATKATQMLSESFELEIPEAVVRTTLINRLTKKDGVLRNESGLFCLNDPTLLNDQDITKAFESRVEKQDALLIRLRSYVEGKYGPLSEEEDESLRRCFSEFLSGNSRQSPFLPFISTFVIENENDPHFISELDDLREGLVLYDGVRHTPDLSSIGIWSEPLAIFLDPEHLFNAVGYNGQLYKALFTDFYKLSREIRTKGKRPISLWYSDYCKDDVESFFYVAELILQGHATPIPGKPAMIEIINGCQSPADVLQKKANFYAELNRLGIRDGSHFFGNVDPNFNIESEGLLQQLPNDFEASKISYDEQKCISTLRTFSVINQLRKGNSRTSFEQSKAIVLTGSTQTKFLAFHPSVREHSNEIPFATDLDFVTNRLWFRLKKGLSKNLSHPTSLSVLAKAQVVLSSQVNDSVIGKYNKVKGDFDNGSLSREGAEYLYNELRSRSLKPEEIHEEDLEGLVSFLNEDSYEAHIREKQHLESRVKQGDAAIKQLREIQARNYRKWAHFWRNTYGGLFYLSCMMLALVILYFYYVGIRVILALSGPQDSLLTIGMAILSLIFATVPLLCIKHIVSFFKAFLYRKLRVRVKHLHNKAFNSDASKAGAG